MDDNQKGKVLSGSITADGVVVSRDQEVLAGTLTTSDVSAPFGIVESVDPINPRIGTLRLTPLKGMPVTEETLKELREQFGDSGSVSVPSTVTDQYPYFVRSPQPRFERPQWLIELFRRFSPSRDLRS